MSEFKGTKGIWKVEECSEIQRLHGIWHYNNEGFPTYVARTCYAPSSKANALLISKAPEMLEMLVKIRDECDGNNFSLFRDEIEQLIKSATKN